MKATPHGLNEYEVGIKNLKRLLKEQQISYKDLAAELGLSESGVKKILSAKDGSFQRLSQMCQIVGVTIYEILQDTKSLDVTFSKIQQDEFLKDLVLFKVYWMLVYERSPQQEVQDKLQLSYKDFFHRLRKLDQLRLIKLHSKDRLQLPSIKAVRWIGQGEFINKIYKLWSRDVLEAISKPHPKENEFFILRYLPMTPNTYKEFRLSLSHLEEEFIRRSIHEMKTKSESTEHVRWLVATDTRSFVG